MGRVNEDFSSTYILLILSNTQYLESFQNLSDA